MQRKVKQPAPAGSEFFPFMYKVDPFSQGDKTMSFLKMH